MRTTFVILIAAILSACGSTYAPSSSWNPELPDQNTVQDLGFLELDGVPRDLELPEESDAMGIYSWDSQGPATHVVTVFDQVFFVDAPGARVVSQFRAETSQIDDIVRLPEFPDAVFLMWEDGLSRYDLDGTHRWTATIPIRWGVWELGIQEVLHTSVAMEFDAAHGHIDIVSATRTMASEGMSMGGGGENLNIAQLASIDVETGDVVRREEQSLVRFPAPDQVLVVNAVAQTYELLSFPGFTPVLDGAFLDGDLSLGRYTHAIRDYRPAGERPRNYYSWSDRKVLWNDVDAFWVGDRLWIASCDFSDTGRDYDATWTAFDRATGERIEAIETDAMPIHFIEPDLSDTVESIADLVIPVFEGCRNNGWQSFCLEGLIQVTNDGVVRHPIPEFPEEVHLRRAGRSAISGDQVVVLDEDSAAWTFTLGSTELRPFETAQPLDWLSDLSIPIDGELAVYYQGFWGTPNCAYIETVTLASRPQSGMWPFGASDWGAECQRGYAEQAEAWPANFDERVAFPLPFWDQNLVVDQARATDGAAMLIVRRAWTDDVLLAAPMMWWESDWNVTSGSFASQVAGGATDLYLLVPESPHQLHIYRVQNTQ